MSDDGEVPRDGETPDPPDDGDAVAAFIRDRPPFQELDGEALRRIASASVTKSFPREVTIIEQGGDPASFLYVIRSGSVEIRHEGRVVDVPSEGEVFGELSLVTGLEPTASVVAHEDTVCYLVDADMARSFLGTPRGNAFIHASLKRVMANAYEHQSSAGIRSAVRDAPDPDAASAAVRGLPTVKGSTIRITPPSDTRGPDRRARPFVRPAFGESPGPGVF